MKALDILLIFSNNNAELDDCEEIKSWEVVNGKIDENDYIDIYDLETVDGEKYEVTIHVTKGE